MRRRRRDIGASLDLLLDTICNTFGGVLFVAMLVVVMLRMTARTVEAFPTDVVTEVDLLMLEKEQSTVSAELESHRRAMELLLEQRSLVDPLADQLWNELGKLKTKRNSIDGARRATLGRAAKLQANINKTATELSEIESHEKELRKKNAELTLAIEEAKKSKTRDAELPRIRNSNKIEVQTSLRYGRFYIWHTYDQDGTRSGLNTDDYVVLEEQHLSLTTTQLPYAGTPIDDSDYSAREFVARIKRFKPGRDYIQVSVWPDSFGQFSRVKELLVDNGFEYRLIPAEEGSKFMDRGGTSEGIQ